MRLSANRLLIAAAVVVSIAVTAVIGIGLSMSRGPERPRVDASVTPEQPVGPAPVYVALGSSYAAGPGEGKVVDHRCGRTADNYPHQVAERLGLRLVDVTCSGANASELTGPAREHQRPIQLSLVPHDAELITVTAGGNDVGYVGRILAQACQNLRALGESCGSGRTPAPPPSAEAFAHLESTMVKIVDAAKKHAPRATIVLVDYAPVASVDALPCAQLPLEPWEVAQTAGIANRMSDINERVARRTDVMHVSTAAADAEHSVCGPQPWVNGMSEDGGALMHPNAAGKTGIADLVVAAVARDVAKR